MLELADVEVPSEFQGTSFLPLLRGYTPKGWQQSMYYRYWMNEATHNVAAHYGVRTKRYKLIYYYYDGLRQAGVEQGVADIPGVVIEELGSEPEWELFDLDQNPQELNNVYADPTYASVVDDLSNELERLQRYFGDEPYER